MRKPNGIYNNLWGSSGDEAVAFINRIKAENRKARHNVYAYVLREGNVSRYSDDGEPQGTGGVPVLDVINKSGLTDVCVVVTRYFGGILLGASGLTRGLCRLCKSCVSCEVWIFRQAEKTAYGYILRQAWIVRRNKSSCWFCVNFVRIYKNIQPLCKNKGFFELL